LGLVFLLRNFGIGPDFWSLVGRYWPIVLILLGLGKVVEYFIHKDAVSLRLGEIIGIILLLLAGTAISRMSSSSMAQIVRDFPIEIGGMRPGRWIGESHTYSEETAYPLERPVPIRIENSYGAVSVSPGSDRELRVRLKKVIYTNESRAKDIAGEIRLETETGEKPEDEYFLVRTNREALSLRGYVYSTDMEIFVPKNSRLRIGNTFGEVRVSNISGKLDLSASHGALEVRDCTGQFALSTRYAEARLADLGGDVNLDARGRVSIENVKGDVTVTDEYSPLEIFNVQGKVTVSARESNLRIEKASKPVLIDARGTEVRVANLEDSLKVTTSNRNVDISDVASDVAIDSRYGTLALKNIRGAVTINSNSDHFSADELGGGLRMRARGSEIRVNGIRGPLDIQTTLRDVIVNDFAGACAVTDEYAAIRVSTQSLGKGDVNLRNRNGDVELFLPEGASFSIDAAAHNGTVQTDYSGLEPTKNPSGGVLKSKVRTGGPNITLQTDYSNIRIYRTQRSVPDRAERDEAAGVREAAR
jgi:DUF4097 and DUF4098 domain-containing protein YvlB